MEQPFSNQLSDGELERLALLLEEMGEALQVIGKIQRHGYESFNPYLPPPAGETNRQLLERELGDVMVAVEMLLDSKDIGEEAIQDRMRVKKHKIKEWLHHQRD